MPRRRTELALQARRGWVWRADADWRWRRALRLLISLHGAKQREATDGDDAVGVFDQRTKSSLTPLELLLRLFAFADVAHVDDDSGNRPVLEQVVASYLQPPPGSVGMPEAKFGGDHCTGRPHEVRKGL